MAAPTFVAAGSAVTTGTVPLPTGWQAGDLALLVYETQHSDSGLDTWSPTGWTLITRKSTGDCGVTGNTTSTKVTVFYRFLQAGDTGPTLPAPQNHVIAYTVAYRGVKASTPIDAWVSGCEGTADTSLSATGPTTTVADTRVVIVASSGADTTAAQFSGWSAPSLDGGTITERADNFTTSGNGGGVAVADGTKASAGSTGTISATLATSFAKAWVVLALAPVAAGQNVAVAQGLETDVGQALGRAKAKAAAQAPELDAGRAVAGAKARAVVQATSSDSAQAVARSKAVTVALAAEADAAQAVGRSKAHAAAQAAEADVGQVLRPTELRPVGQALESESGLGVGRSKATPVSQALETNTALVIRPTEPRPVGQASSTDIGQPADGAKAKGMGQALEAETAQLVGRARARTIAEAAEADAGQQVSRAGGKTIPVVEAAEADAAQTIGGAKAGAIGQAASAETAQAIARSKRLSLAEAFELEAAQAVARLKRLGVVQALETDLALSAFAPQAGAPATETSSRAMTAHLSSGSAGPSRTGRASGSEGATGARGPE